MTPEKQYILNGDRLARIERVLDETHAAAIRAQSAVESILMEQKTYREGFCREHATALLNLRSQVARNTRKVNSKWPALIMMFFTQLAAAIIAIIGWLVWLHPMIDKGAGQ